MVVLDVVLRQCAVILATFLVQEVDGVGLLQERVSHVLLISKNPVPFLVPALLSVHISLGVCSEPVSLSAPVMQNGLS